ncbi:MAG: 30S ribosomal protein S6 [Mariprofundaceae bacterium]|nr:30S ribosomal protein S6 [Mariprofundaceae bacterium]
MYYETIFIVNPDVSQENTDEFTDTLVQRVEKAGGRIVKREYWGSRPLAYQIAKRKRGHYVLLVTDGEAKAATTLEKGLRLDERVMRFLTTRLTELSDEPSPLLRRKARAEEKSSEETSGEEKPAAEKAEAGADADAAKAEASVEAKAEDKIEDKTEDKTEADAETVAAAKAETSKAASDDKAEV